MHHFHSTSIRSVNSGRCWLSAGCGLAALILAMPALAQTAASPAPAPAVATADANTGLTDIIVTAQKRSESSQRIPLSINAVSGLKLTAAHVTDVQGLTQLDPDLQIGQSSGVITPFIRGIGSEVTTAGDEASVPVYIDDVYFVRAASAFFDLNSVDRVEVLKGPQGTLFGRNASGGVVSIYTRDPGFKPQLDATVGYGNYNTVDAKLYANLPITQNLAANLAVSYHNQQDGWGKNRPLIDSSNPALGYGPGTFDVWKDKYVSLRGKILWQPTPTTTIKLIGYYENSNTDLGLAGRSYPGTVNGSPDAASNGFPIPVGAPVPSQALPNLRNYYDVSLYTPEFDKSHGGGVSARIDQGLGFADLVSITAYRHANELYHSDGNFTDYNWLYYDLYIVDHQFSQEVQLKSKASSKVSWIVGFYYLNATGGFSPTAISGPGVNALGLQSIGLYGLSNTKSLSGFGQVTYPVTATTNITAGLRYTSDKLSGAGHTLSTLLPALGIAPITSGNFTDTEKQKKLTYKIGFDHKFDRGVMAYFNYSRGFKAGTFNTLPLTTGPLKPEVVDAYEAGIKTQTADRTLRFNAALFWNDISNQQVQENQRGLIFLANAASGRTRGGEFDAAYAPGHDLTFTLAGTYLDARFLDFPNCPTYAYSTVAPGNLAAGVGNCTGKRLPFASKFKFSGGVNYTPTILDLGKMAFNLNANWQSKFAWEPNGNIVEPDHFFLDGSIALTPEFADHFTFRIWAKNITGTKWASIESTEATGSAYSFAPGAPRTFGGEINFKF